MPGSVLTYSPKDVIIQIAGYTLTGVLGVEFTYTQPAFKMEPGIRGINTRVMSRNLSGSVRLEIQQTSVTNDVLSTLVIQDMRTKTSRLDLVIKDASGTTFLESDQAYVRGQADNMKFSQSFEPRQWVLDIISVSSFKIGGNASAGVDLFSSVSGALETLGAGLSSVASDASAIGASIGRSISSII